MIDWTDTTPLRLAVAAERAFPDGGMTASGLRKEAARGHLVIQRVAGKDFTTLSAIAEMLQHCRVDSRKGAGALMQRASVEAQSRALAKLATLRRGGS